MTTAQIDQLHRIARRIEVARGPRGAAVTPPMLAPEAMAQLLRALQVPKGFTGKLTLTINIKDGVVGPKGAAGRGRSSAVRACGPATLGRIDLP